MTRRETWSELGPFAGRFFAYYEDIDWCWRANWRGKQLLYDPAATVEHRRSASSGGEHEPWVRVMSERNRTLTHGPQRPSPAGRQSPTGPRRQRPRWRGAGRYRPLVAVGIGQPGQMGGLVVTPRGWAGEARGGVEASAGRRQSAA